MPKINSGDVKTNSIGATKIDKTGESKENKTTNSSSGNKTNENEFVEVTTDEVAKEEKGFFKMMADLVVNFFKKIFGSSEVSAEIEDSNINDTPRIDDEIASAVDNRLGAGFSCKIEEVSKNLNCDPVDLLTVLYSESSLNPKAKNSSGAVGLMQFMPSTLKELGYTTADIENMTASEQLDVVQKYFEKNNYYHKGEKLSAAQLYAMVLAPGRAKGEIMYTQGKDGLAYTQNEGLDKDDNGTIAMGDLDKHLQNKNTEMQESLLT